jgi:siroheme synthase
VTQLRDNLVAEGMAAAIPAAVIANGGRADATIRRGTLADLPDLVRDHPPGPALVIIGDVVGRDAASVARDHEPVGLLT